MELDAKRGPYLLGNGRLTDNKINPSSQQVREGGRLNSNLLSADDRVPLKPLKESQQYNIPSNQDKDLNGSNFITLGKISEEDKIEIIQTGFQLQNQGKISLKKYSEGTEKYSLFQLKGYNIKYESIRRNKLYQKFKE